MAAVVLFLVVLGTFLPTLRNGFVNYDDPMYVTENAWVQKGLTKEGLLWACRTSTGGSWHPLTWLSHMLDCQLFGLNPAGHHFTSVFLHAMSAVVAFLALRRLTGAFWASLAAAALFGLHPLRVESVAWAAERKDTLSTLFWMLALWAYAGWAPRGDGSPDRNRQSCYWMAFVFFALGLMSKPMLVTFPCALLLVDFWPLRRPFAGRGWMRLAVEKLPFLLLTFAACVVTLFTQRQAGGTDFVPVALPDRLGNAVVAYVRYLAKFFLPTDLAVLYPHPGQWPAATVVAAGLSLLALTAVGWWLRDRCPALLVGWLWFLGTLVPTIGLVQVGLQSMADRYTYIPSLGLGLMLVGGLTGWSATRPGFRPVFGWLAGAAFPTLIALTIWQTSFWADSEILFRRLLAVVGEHYVPHLNLGTHYAAEGRLHDAIAECEKALALAPAQCKVRPHLSLGVALLAAGKPAAAVAHFEAAFAGAPGDVRARFLYAVALSRCDRQNDAIAQYQEVLRLEPERVTASNNLGILLARSGRPTEALAQFRRAIELQPAYAEAHNNAGMLLADQGDWDQAMGCFREALRLKPDYSLARQNLDAAERRVAR